MVLHVLYENIIFQLQYCFGRTILKQLKNLNCFIIDHEHRQANFDQSSDLLKQYDSN